MSNLTALLPVILTMNEQLHHLILGQDITLHLMFHTKCPPLKKKYCVVETVLSVLYMFEG